MSEYLIILVMVSWIPFVIYHWHKNMKRIDELERQLDEVDKT